MIPLYYITLIICTFQGICQSNSNTASLTFLFFGKQYKEKKKIHQNPQRKTIINLWTSIFNGFYIFGVVLSEDQYQQNPLIYFKGNFLYYFAICHVSLLHYQD